MSAFGVSAVGTAAGVSAVDGPTAGVAEEAWAPHLPSLGLHPFQQEGVRALLERPGLLLADDMGLGKTVQATVALRLLAAAGRLGEALVVVPAGLVAQWQQALRRWAPELAVSTVRGPVAERAWQWRVPAQVRLVGYDTLRSDVTDNPSCPPQPDVGRGGAGRGPAGEEPRHGHGPGLQAPAPTPGVVAYRHAPRKPRGGSAVGPRVHPPVDRRPARRRPPARRHAGPASGRGPAPPPSPRRAGRAPAKAGGRDSLELGGAQRESYLRAERLGIVRLAALGRDVRVAHVLELITRLKQICNVCPATATSAKLDDLEARLDELSAQGHRALVFSQYTSADHGIGAIATRCARLRPLVYTGAQSLHERNEVVERFRADTGHRVLALSLRAGGLGLNLQQASYVVHFDRWWNPAVERQAEDRCHRMGQPLPVTVYAYRCVGTIEDRIQRILAESRPCSTRWSTGCPSAWTAC